MSESAVNTQKLQREYRNQQRRRLAMRLFLVGIAIVYALFPVVWVLSVSLNPANTNVVREVIPEGATLRWYEELLNSDLYSFTRWMWNSVRISTITMILSVLVSTFSAYAFSRFRFSGRRTTLLGVFLVQVFPSSLLIVAIFLLIQQFGDYVPWLGLNHSGGVILVYLGSALGINTWLMKGFFDSIPRELDESAKIDGASHWRTFWSIIFPLVRPILAVVGILVFIANYNDYIIALTLLKENDQQTLAVGLNLFIGSTRTEWGLFAAGAIMGAVPIVVLYLLMQDYIVGGLTSGAVKG